MDWKSILTPQPKDLETTLQSRSKPLPCLIPSQAQWLFFLQLTAFCLATGHPHANAPVMEEFLFLLYTERPPHMGSFPLKINPFKR